MYTARTIYLRIRYTSIIHEQYRDVGSLLRVEGCVAVVVVVVVARTLALLTDTWYDLFPGRCERLGRCRASSVRPKMVTQWLSRLLTGQDASKLRSQSAPLRLTSWVT